jgi:hypothetical protein
VIIGGGKNSYVFGCLRQVYNSRSRQEHFYPIGNETGYRPMKAAFRHNKEVDNIYEVCVKSPTIDSDRMKNGVEAVSKIRYWHITAIDKNATVNQADYTFYWWPDDNVKEINKLICAKYMHNQNIWGKPQGTFEASGTTSQGWIKYNDNDQEVNHWVLATTDCPESNVDVVIEEPFQVGYPDTTVAHTAAIQNTGNKKESFNVHVTSNNNWKVEMYNSGSVMIARDENGDGDWEFVKSGYDKDNDGNPETPELKKNESESYSFVVYIPMEAIIGTLDTLTIFASGECGSGSNQAFTEVDEPFVLPIELLYFSAKVNVDHVKLEWATASELNNEYFTLERSKNGADFHGFEEIKGAGNSNKTLVYASKDVLPEGPAMYYRLKQTDFDGTVSYSKVVAVKGTNKEVIELVGDVYPNPFNRDFAVNFNAGEEGNMVATIIDIQGKIVARNVVHVSKGFNQFTFDQGTSLPKGMYFLTFEHNGAVITSKLSKTADN